MKYSFKHRKSPGETSKGKFYHIEIEPKSKFKWVVTHDVGQKGHLERVTGKMKNGRWATAAWLISKKDAHASRGKLVGDTPPVKALLKMLGKTIHKKGDIYRISDTL
jgi:hypothetical protein